MAPINLDPMTFEEGYPPVEHWHPENCGEMDIVIRENGEWLHDGAPIVRDKMVTLFSRILWREGEGYYLVTPAEKVRIQVEDAPFHIVRYERVEEANGLRLWRFFTLTNDVLTLGVDSEMALFEHKGDLLPYASVRHGMWASFHRNVYYQLIEEASMVEDGETTQVQLTSANKVYTIGTFHEM